METLLDLFSAECWDQHPFLSSAWPILHVELVPC